MKIQRETTVVHLFNGPARAKARELIAAIEVAAGAQLQPQRIAPSVSTLDEAAKAYDDYAAECLASGDAVGVVVSALRKGDWVELMREHPPKPDDEQDERYGFDVDAAADPVVTACLAQAVEDEPDCNPGLETPSKRTEFVANLSAADVGRLLSAAVLVNRGESPDPKADMSSRVTRIFGETSESPSPST